MKVRYSDYRGGSQNNYQYTVFFEPQPGARFNVIFYGGKISLWRKELTMATKTSKDAAADWIEKMGIIPATARCQSVESESSVRP